MSICHSGRASKESRDVHSPLFGCGARVRFSVRIGSKERPAKGKTKGPGGMGCVWFVVDSWLSSLSTFSSLVSASLLLPDLFPLFPSPKTSRTKHTISRWFTPQGLLSRRISSADPSFIAEPVFDIADDLLAAPLLRPVLESTPFPAPLQGKLYQVVRRLTPVATITSSVALSNLLSGPSVPSPKRRFSVSPDGSDDYDGRASKSARTDILTHQTPVRPNPQVFAQPSPAVTSGPEQQASRQQPQHQQPQQQGAAQQTRHAQARMRSSIACVRCRRSKVKCVNSGVGTPCRSCEAGNRECTYPVPVAGGRKREGSLSGPVQRPDISMDEVGGTFMSSGYPNGRLDDFKIRKSRQQRRSSAGLPGQLVPTLTEPTSAPMAALDTALLTPTVWKELFDIFQLHFSADLPFIHPPTFLKPLCQPNPSLPQHRPAPPVQPPAPTEFLLAFLALTARFHPVVVAHHSPPTAGRPSNPLVAADFYATAASAQLNAITCEDLSTIQAMLMLTLHEWGMNRGHKAWGYLGIVIRSAQAMGLHYEEDLDDQPLSRSLPLSFSEQALSESGRLSPDSVTGLNNAFIQHEVRRRTLWACFILDRYLSNGKYRPQGLYARDLRIQLPASEHAFLFGEKVRTLLLGDEGTSRAEVQSQRRASLAANPVNVATRRFSISEGANGKPTSQEQDQGRWETGPDEGLISRYIKVLDIHSKVSRWICGGGRKRDALPPWNPQSEWYSLRKSLEDFKAGLPRHHTLTAQNSSAHINLRTSTPYALVHLTLSLSQLLLCREFLPFIPFRHGKPQGPLDGTRLDVLPAPHGFWEDSARECFAAAHDIVDLVSSFQEWDVVVETPLVGFALYNVALLGVYVTNFPWMDTQGHLRRAAREDGVTSGAETTRKAIELLASTKIRLQMANGWFETVKRAHKYFSQLRKIWVDSAARLPGLHDQSIATAQLHPPNAESTRVLLERLLKESDNSGDSDVEMSDHQAHDGNNGVPAPPGSDISSPRTGTGTGSTPPKTIFHNAAEQAQAHAQQEERWNAINSVAAAASAVATGRTTTQLTTPGQPNSSHFPLYSSYPSTSSTTSNYAGHGFRAAFPGTGNLPQPQLNSHPQTPIWAPTNGREPLQSIHSYVGGQQRDSEATGGPLHRPIQDREIRDVEAWLGVLEKPFGGDDVAALVDGVEFAEYASRSSGLRSSGWLASVWGR